MIILNTVKEKCKGVWARVQGEEKSITDYVLTDATSANTVKETKIDEEKWITRTREKQQLVKIKRYTQITISY